jgi:hypothetical protein
MTDVAIALGGVPWIPFRFSVHDLDAETQVDFGPAWSPPGGYVITDASVFVQGDLLLTGWVSFGISNGGPVFFAVYATLDDNTQEPTLLYGDRRSMWIPFNYDETININNQFTQKVDAMVSGFYIPIAPGLTPDYTSP